MKNNILLILIVTALSGCNYLDQYSQDLVVAKSVTDFDEVLLGDVYLSSKEQVKELAYGDPGWWLHILDDDINTVAAPTASSRSWNYAMKQSYFGYTTWQMEVGRSYDKNNLSGDNDLWNDLYRRINVTNIILDEIEDVAVHSEEEQLAGLRIRGEARFLRAQFYLMLVNVYADMYRPESAATTPGVPLKLTSYVEHDKDKDSQFDRTPVAQVYGQIVTDLTASIGYFTQSPQTRSFYRASKEAAQLLLSRVYLYMQDWENAKQVAGELLKSKPTLKHYANLNDDEEIISRKNPEILFSQGSLNLQNVFTAEGGDFCLSADLYNLYEDTDYRKTLFFTKTLNDSIALGRKYKRDLHQSYVSDLYLLRTSEAYLNIAEACAMLGQNQEASDWLNLFREHRIDGWQNTTYGPAEIIEEVRKERRKELCLEGHRWFDLRRQAVCAKAPSAKPLTRMFTVYDYDNKMLYMHTEQYELPAGDPAYTFAIPKSVLEFDVDMTDNIRPIRKPTKLIKFNWL